MNKNRLINTNCPVKDENSVVVNESGVHTMDRMGNNFFCGYRQIQNSMTEFYFKQAKQFWANQTLNGQPLNLLSVHIKMAANNTIPYNSPAQRRLSPQAVARKESNRVAWYNIKFENAETGWICNKMYYSQKEAAQSVTSETVLQLYTDKKVVACVRAMIEKQK